MLPLIVRTAAVEYGDKACYVTPDGWTVSYEQLLRFSDEAAVGLARMGITEGSVVALVLPSTVEYVVLYAALAKLGAVTAGSNPRYTPRETSAVLAVCGADLVITTDARSCPDQTDVLEISVAETAETMLPTLRVPGESPPMLEPRADRPVCICFTSGSTGDPKGAWYAERQLSAIAELDTGGAWGGGGHTLASTAFAHIGFMTKLPWMLAAGGTMHLQERWRASTTLRLLHEFKMPSVSAVAPQLALMVRQPEFDDYDFSAVRAIVVGGAASPPALVHECRTRFGAPYSIRYSSTESGGIGLATALDADDEEALYTIGRPRPGVRAEIRDEAMAAVPDGEVGELWLSSPTTMSGYWNAPDATSETLVDGWLRTGDLAHVDERGCYRLSGRVKEMFIRGGYNVYPMEVESVLGTHPQVAEVAVIPRHDDVMGEIGVAVVVAMEGAEPPTLAALREHAAVDLASYKLPEAVKTVDRLPRNASEKVDRKALLAEERGEGRPEGRP